MYRGIPTFRRHPGAHCASVALRDVAAYYGNTLSEEMIFGLGAGLGGYYYTSLRFPHRVFIGRAPDLEANFFRVLGIEFTWNSGVTLPWTSIQQFLDRGIPVVALADLRYLDYYDSVSMFGGHTLVLVGYEGEKVYVADPMQDQIQVITLAALRRALASVSPLTPGLRPNQWAAVMPFSIPHSLGDAVRRALRANASFLLEPPLPYVGLPAVAQMARDIPNWTQLPDWWKYCLLYYEFSERRGTGGAAFRRLYARFLAEAEAHVPELAQLEAAPLMERAAGIWSEVSRLMLETARTRQPAYLVEIGQLLDQAVQLESTVFRRIQSEIRPAPPGPGG